MDFIYLFIDLMFPKEPLTQKQFLEKLQNNDFDLRKKRFIDVDLKGIELAQFKLQESDLRFARNLSQAIFPKAILTRCDLRGCDLSGINLSQTILSGARLQNVNISRSACIKANFSYAKLHKANCTGTIFSGTNLSHTQFNRANVVGARLDRTNLTKADFSWANINWCDFSNANLARVRFWGNVFGSINTHNTILSVEQMRKARRDIRSIVSPGMSLKDILFGNYPTGRKR